MQTRMPPSRATVDAVVRDILDQLPMMKVGRVNVQSGPASDGCLLVRIEFEAGGHVLCEIDEDGGLRSAHGVEN